MHREEVATPGNAGHTALLSLSRACASRGPWRFHANPSDVRRGMVQKRVSVRLVSFSSEKRGQKRVVSMTMVRRAPEDRRGQIQRSRARWVSIERAAHSLTKAWVLRAVAARDSVTARGGCPMFKTEHEDDIRRCQRGSAFFSEGAPPFVLQRRDKSRPGATSRSNESRGTCASASSKTRNLHGKFPVSRFGALATKNVYPSRHRHCPARPRPHLSSHE